MSIQEQRGTLGTVRNAALLLDLLSEGPPYQQLTDLAERAGMSLPTVHRLLRSLVAAGLVEQDAKSSRYGLGPQLVYLSERYLARLPVVNAAAPYLVQLRDVLDATVQVAVLVRGHIVYVDRVDAGDAGGVFRETARMRLAFETPAGRLLIARADVEEWRKAEAAAEDAASVELPSGGDREAWARAAYLASVPNGGGGAFEIAVPIRGATTPLACLTATGNESAADGGDLEQRLAPQLERAAQAVARTIGHA